MIVGAVLLFRGYHSAASMNDFIAFYWSGNDKNIWFPTASERELVNIQIWIRSISEKYTVKSHRLILLQHLQNVSHSKNECQTLFSCALRPGVRWQTPACEDVAHLLVHVPTLPPLTCDLTNCQSHRKSSQQTHQPALLLLSPCTSLTLRPVMQLYEKMPGLQKH